MEDERNDRAGSAGQAPAGSVPSALDEALAAAAQPETGIRLAMGAGNASRFTREGAPGGCRFMTFPSIIAQRHGPGWAVGMAMAAGTEHVCFLTDVASALSGPGLEAALYAGSRPTANLTLVVRGSRPTACDPAALYAAMGWKAMETGTVSPERMLGLLLSCRGLAAPSILFVYAAQPKRRTGDERPA